MPIRLALSAAPAWQVIFGVLLLAAATGTAGWIVGRVVRATMLLYGQRLSVRGLLDAVRA
jgi:hypothetical protein